MATARIEHDQMVDPAMLLGPDPNRCEKNHMVIGSGLSFVYTCNPPVVINEGVICTRQESAMRPESTEFRGGGPIISNGPLTGSFTGIVHEVNWATGHRRYFHRFCQFDHRGYLIAFTPPFFFNYDKAPEGVPLIEYAAGIVEHGDDYVVSFGAFSDSRAFLARAPKVEVHQAMQSAFA